MTIKDDTLAQYDLANATLFAELIRAAVRKGGAIRFGRSKDGKNFAIGIYAYGQTYTTFRPGTIDLAKWLGQLARTVESLTPEDLGVLGNHVEGGEYGTQG